MKTYYIKIAARNELDEWQQQEVIVALAKAVEGRDYAIIKIFSDEQIKECTSTYYRKKVKSVV